MPLISIIIPLRNRLKIFEQCLDSIKKQTYEKYEIIIVNDGSTEFGPGDLGKLMRKYNFLNAAVINQENKGAAAARNRGFKASSGTYVIFCDADVIMRPDMLEMMVRALDKNQHASYAYASFRFGWKTFRLWEFNSDRLKKMPYIHTTSLIRRECFCGFDESLKRFMDWDLWLSMLKNGHTGIWINQVLFTVKSGGKISSWMPSFLVTLGIGNRAKEYKESAAIIFKKHGISAEPRV